MDKNAIKKYAVWARRELIERVSQKAASYGITSQTTEEALKALINSSGAVVGSAVAGTAVVGDRVLSDVERKQRQALCWKILEKGYEQVMEEVAYTWFNRFSALRFMEVNNYLPSHTRVFTNEVGEFKPQILADAIQIDLDGLDMDKVYELKSANKIEELYKYLLIIQCNALSSILPGIFQKIADYTELLLPDYLLREGSIIEQMVTTIPEEDWTDQVQIIGWLYQYYNIEPKDKVFADLKKNIKISKENIPAATQLFTPDWIVHYMVENSLGRLWLEGHPNDALKSEWKYYLDEAKQDVEVEAQLDNIRKEYAALKPEEILVIDPCMGSGHILCVLFDVLVRIYEDYGYTAREAAVKIVENNIWGLDIDERATQLSYFAVMMKARQYDRRFFTRKVQPRVYAIEESNGITSAPMHDMGLNLTQEEYSEAVKQAMRLVKEMHDAKEYGSIIHVTSCDWSLLRRFAVPRDEYGQLHLDVHGEIEASARLQRLINVGETLSQKYHVSITNPPYMGTKGMNSQVAAFLKDNYSEGKGDLFAVFIMRLEAFVKTHGYFALVTQRTWLFISAFEKLRKALLETSTGVSFVELGAGAFEDLAGEVVQSVLFSMQKGKVNNYTSVYCDVTQFENKEKAFLYAEQKRTRINDFELLPGYTFAMKLSNVSMVAYKNGKTVGMIAQPKKGLISSDNNRFLRLWTEVNIDRVQFHLSEMDYQDATKRWLPHNKGGSFRRWYGNHEYLINWENNGAEVKGYAGKLYGSYSRQIMNEKYYLQESISWSSISSQKIGVRYYPVGFIFDTAGPSMFISDRQTRNYIFGLLGSCVAEHYIKATNPTINLLASDISNLPLLGIDDNDKRNNVNDIVDICVEIAKSDWDSFETSWDFKEHPFITSARWIARTGKVVTIRQAFEDWKSVAEGRFNRLKEKEEELNHIFIDIYGLGDELSPTVEDKDVTVRRADWKRDVRSFISYAVGCMFGRYSLDYFGLIYAGGEWDASKYMQFQPDKDAIIPICDDEYFEDDIVGRFVSFVETIFGKEVLEDNLREIADALGGNGSSREVIRNYFINDFYTDHLKVYQKRPIYWLFDSGKKNGFKCLVYMHRYQPDTIARIRTDYVHEQQSRYRTAIANLEQYINSASSSERVKLTKKLTTLQTQAEEIRVYEEKIHHFADQMIKIDLDDGVKHNYSVFKDVLSKI